MNETSPNRAKPRKKEPVTGVRRFLKGPVGLAVIGLGILIPVVVIVLWQSGVSGSIGYSDALTYVVKRGDLNISFHERGNIEASQSTQVYCRIEGSSTIVSIVPEGASVKEGDLLVELDSSQLTQEINQQEIQVESAHAELIQAQEELKIQKSQNQSDLDLAQLTLDLARIDLKKYLEGDWPMALDRANGDIFLARQQLENAKNDFEWTKRLHEKGYVTKTQLKSDELLQNKYEVDKRQSELALEVLKEYTREKDLKQYQSNVEQAEAALERTNSKNSAYLAKAQADFSAKNSKYTLAVEQLQKLKDQLSKTKIYAPQDGLVIYRTERRGRQDRIVEQGANVRENQHLISLPDVSTMAVSMQVHESRIDQVTMGTLAFVSIDALPQLKLRGRVTKVGLLPDSVNRWLNPDSKVYPTEITLDHTEDVKLVRPGMSAKVELLIARLEDILFVPVQSVTTIEGVHHCYVLENGAFVPQEVQVGLFNDSFIEIREGLADGDTIKLLAPKPQGTQNRGTEIPDEEMGDVNEAMAEVTPPDAGPRRGWRSGGGDGEDTPNFRDRSRRGRRGRGELSEMGGGGGEFDRSERRRGGGEFDRSAMRRGRGEFDRSAMRRGRGEGDAPEGSDGPGFGDERRDFGQRPNRQFDPEMWKKMQEQRKKESAGATESPNDS